MREDMSAATRKEMVSKMRWGERNSGLVRQILNDLVTYSVGDGIRPQSHATDPETARLYEEYFADWARRCEVTNRFSFWESQRIAERAWSRDGDFFLVKVRDRQGRARVQLMEAHMVGDPANSEDRPEGMVDGVQFDAVGAVVGYSAYDRSPRGFRVLPGSSVMHVHDAEHASGARGVPMLQHSWNDIQDEMEILAIEKTAVKDAGEITRVLNRGSGEFGADLSSELASNDQAAYALGVGMGGKFLALNPGESLTSVQSNRPSPAFTGFLTAIQSDISRGILPYEFTTDPTKGGSAGIRLVTAKADRTFSRHQTVLIERMCVPTWGWVIADAIERGELPDDPSWNKVSWTTPKRVTVDAGREAANDRADVEMGLMSMSELYGQRGMDFREEMEKRASDMAFIRDLATRNGLPFELLYRMSNAQPGAVQMQPEPEPPAPSNS
jgi:capsid protein